MDETLFWFVATERCPFDNSKLGRHKQIFKSDSGDLRLKIWVCPLCERHFIEYDNNHNVLKRFPMIKCQFLYYDSPAVNAKRTEEIRWARYQRIQEPSPKQYTKYKQLFLNYSMSISSFCECFSEITDVYRFFQNRFNPREETFQSFFAAIDDDNIPNDTRLQIKRYKKLCDERERQSEIKKLFASEYYDEAGNPYILDDEQALALAVQDKRVLVTARAGSGKTRVIVAKIVYLMEHEGVSQNKILSLAFNRNVPIEINYRTKLLLQSHNSGQQGTIDVAKTFHSLAYQITEHKEVLSGTSRTQFIQDIITFLKETSPSFAQLVYDAFRKESAEINKTVDGYSHSVPSEYYEIMKNAQHETLHGEIVKSTGEKWIADYFYEHGVKYEYEPCFYPKYISNWHVIKAPQGASACLQFLDQNSETRNKRTIRKTVKPDFWLIDYNCVWEHWGIDENDSTNKNLSSNFEMTWAQYRRLMEWKRLFWNGEWRRLLRINGIKAISRRSPERHIDRIKNINLLLESSVVEMQHGREAFEEHLSIILDQHRIAHEPRNKEELIEEVWEKQIKRFTAMMESFINKFEQKHPDQDYSAFEMQVANLALEERVKDFLKLGLIVLKHYHKILRAAKKPRRFEKYNGYSHDFYQLIADAAKRIQEGKADELFLHYQYLLIDEYQDFSELFYRFICAVLDRNSDIQLFCVGDNWQAINRFAGSDTLFFDNFTHYFPNSRTLQIRTNYRSSKSVVDLSNRFMERCGFKDSRAIPSKRNVPHCSQICVSDLFIALTEEYENYSEDAKFLTLLSDDWQSREVSLYLKKIIDIVCRNQGASVFILSRTNRFDRYDINYVQRKIRSFLLLEKGFTSDDVEKVEVMTMHSSKGLQANIVIILEANEKSIPKVHPDNDLYQVFGETKELNYQDEEKLFYVALTRAKEQFYILYDKEPSPFIGKLSRQDEFHD